MVSDGEVEIPLSTMDRSHENPNKTYPVKKIPIVPGTQQYSDKVKQNLPSDTTSYTKQSAQNLLVLSTSITKGIDTYRFNECFENGTARFQKWGGGRAKHIKTYVDTHIQEEQPDVVLVQAGGNDLAAYRNKPISLIANDIMEIATKASNWAVKHVFVGGVTVRETQFTKERLNELNRVLASLCKARGFVFINNDEITIDHLSDGVHLTKEGTRILANNYLDALRERLNGNPVICSDESC